MNCDFLVVWHSLKRLFMEGGLEEEREGERGWNQKKKISQMGQIRWTQKEFFFKKVTLIRLKKLE